MKSDLILQPQQQTDIISVHRHLFEMSDGTLEFGQDTLPKFTAPVLKNKEGKLVLDKNNIKWIDECSEEEKQEIFEEMERNDTLQGMYDNITPVESNDL